MVLVASVGWNVLVDLSDPRIQPLERLDRRRHVYLHSQVPQSAETRRDIQRDVIVGWTAGEPRPAAVGILLIGNLLLQARRFVVESVIVEEDADIAAGLALTL